MELEVIQIMTNFGVGTFIALYLLIIFRKTIDKNTHALEALTTWIRENFK